MERLRSLSEEECYLRCYGSTGLRELGSDDSVRLVSPNEAARSDPRLGASRDGERLRRLLELRIDGREPFEAA